MKFVICTFNSNYDLTEICFDTLPMANNYDLLKHMWVFQYLL